MIIEELELNDFGPFDGKHHIKFKPGVNVIFGSNGSGKTCVFRAIRFAIFGEMVSKVGPEFINYNSLVSGVTQAKVKITFNLVGNKYIVERILSKDGDLQTIVHGQKKILIEDIYQKLPPYSAPFFLFDGEEIRQWILSLGNNKWDTASILGFNIYQGIIKDIKNTKSKLIRLLTELEQRSGIALARDKIESLQNEIGQNRKHISDIEPEIRNVNDLLAKLNKIKGFTEKNSANLKKMKIINKKIKQLKKSVQISWKKARKDAQIAPFALIKNDFMQALKLVEHMKELSFNARLEQGRLDAQLEILKEINKNERCICGNELAASSFGKRSISNLFREMEDDVSDFDKAAKAEYWPNLLLLDMGSKVELADLAASELKNELKSINQKQGQLVKTMNEQKQYEIAIKELNEKVGPLIEDLPVIEKKWTSPIKLENKISKYQRKKSAFFGRIDTYNNIIKLKEVELNNNEKNLKNMRTIEKEQINKIINANQTLDQMSIKIESTVSNAIEQLMKELKIKFKDIFKSITNKPTEFIGVDFSSSEGTPVIITKNGLTLSMNDISDGEKQILIFALMSALKYLSPTDALVVDAPFGRLDSTHIDSITEFLPEMAKQTIILITDREFQEINKRNIVSTIWRINNNDNSSKFELLE